MFRSSECDVCDDRGYLLVERDGKSGVVRCDCRKRKAAREKLAAIPERYRLATFENYVPKDKKQTIAHARIRDDLTESFFIFGDYARGKTHLAIAQYRRLVETEHSTLFFTMGDLLAELRHAELDGDYFCLVRERVRHASALHIFIDDIEKYKVTEFKTEALFDLFDTIWKRKLGLTITSNHTITELSASEALHPSVMRRIDAICAAVEV